MGFFVKLFENFIIAKRALLLTGLVEFKLFNHVIPLLDFCVN